MYTTNCILLWAFLFACIGKWPEMWAAKWKLVAQSMCPLPEWFAVLCHKFCRDDAKLSNGSAGRFTSIGVSQGWPRKLSSVLSLAWLHRLLYCTLWSHGKTYGRIRQNILTTRKPVCPQSGHEPSSNNHIYRIGLCLELNPTREEGFCLLSLVFFRTHKP